MLYNSQFRTIMTGFVVHGHISPQQAAVRLLCLDYIWCSPRMNSLSAPEVLRRETPRNRGGARSDREQGVSGGRRSHGTSARAAIFAQGKETGLKGSSF